MAVTAVSDQSIDGFRFAPPRQPIACAESNLRWKSFNEGNARLAARRIPPHIAKLRMCSA